VIETKVEWRPRTGGGEMRHAFVNDVGLCIRARSTVWAGVQCSPFGPPDPDGSMRGVQTCERCLVQVRRLR